MGSGAILMSEKKKVDYAAYGTVKIDVELIPLIRAAAALSGKNIQEWASDHLNRLAAEVLERNPIKRKPAPPHPKRNPKK